MTNVHIDARLAALAYRHPLVCRIIQKPLFALCILMLCGGPGKSAAEATDAAPESKLVRGRLGAGAMVISSYSGSADYQTIPVPLASLKFGEFGYIEYWQAGVYFLANQEKTLGLALVVAPRLGFNSSDGERLVGMMTRRPSIETGLSLDYGSAKAGISLSYVHDVTGASDGGAARLFFFTRLDITDHFGVDAFLGLEQMDSKVANYYYGVRTSEATLARPFYEPGAGTKLHTGLHFNYDFGRKSTLLFGLENDRLGSSLTNSPIVERRFTNLFYLGYGWRL
jgi:outer membrane protein